ncbi:MAG: serine/threonine protein kinase, partial [Planctomycetaceae bacterium]|nr:serine/threonine protein kinase [Planctomycetaceae bacterium]
ELDRRVALKLLNPAGRPRDTSRLVREAQALARLSHPAIASVFDVGVCEYGAFVVMERVVGRSLHELLGGRARRWSALRPLFLEIGDALAAAHDANLVHRDIKPANIMIDQRGRPRIIDFGLAHDPRESGSTIAGTPSYMAPEALEGAPIDARADVYSYCVVLFEALTGTRPFVGDTLAAQLASKRYARPWERLSRRLPSRLRRALERGLDP